MLDICPEAPPQTPVLKGNKDNRDNILKLEKAISNEFSQDDVDKIYPVNHHFAPGAYAREIFIPKGHVVVGKIHRHAHLNIISKGKVQVVTEEGKKTLEPGVFISPAGVKRAVYAIEDTTWTTIHVTEETDLKKIEDYVIAPSFDALNNDEKERLE